MGKLTLFIISSNVKQNLDYVLFLRSHSLGKLKLSKLTKDETSTYASSHENKDSPWVLVKGF